MNKIDELISKMTLEEKAAMCTGASPWTTIPVDRLGIPVMTVSDGPHGLRREAEPDSLVSESLPATCFPTASCTASTWDVDLIHEMGNALAEECIAQHVDVVLGPGVNMKRTPLCGRNFEYFSEDPFLAGQMGASFINGVQSKGVGTSLKHYATNNQETRRLIISSEMDERTLREIYLPAFETAVKQGKPWTVMCAYNQFNGTFCSENRLLLADILKREWGFEGLVVSDWGAVHDRVASLVGGLDLEMPGPRDLRVKSLLEAVRSGKVDEAMLDESVRRIVNIVFKAAATPKGASFDIEAHHALARRITGEAIVLLKNNGILPLKMQQHIAVIGRAAKVPYYQGGGSSHINPTRLDIPLDELQKLAGNTRLTYSEGYLADGSSSQELTSQAVENAQQADVALLYVALPEAKESEGYDRPDLDLAAEQVELIEAVCTVQPNSVVVINNGAPVVMAEWIESPAAVLEAWMMGQAGGGAIADVLYGKVNPCGKLAETFPLRLEDTPAYINFPGDKDTVTYGEGIFIGYRYYDTRKIPVQFPFGYGLSYTTFSYQNLRLSAKSFRDVEGLNVFVDVTNNGKLAGKEVVQVYVHDHKSSLVRPPKELKGFAKLQLQPGETKTVSIRLDFRAFAFYHPGYHQWITEDGEFDILIGASSTDIRCRETVHLTSTTKLPCALSRRSTVRDWMEDPHGKLAAAELFEIIDARMREIFGGGEVDGRDTMSFLMDMPLTDLLYFFDGTLSASPEEIVDGLLSVAHEGDDRPGSITQA
jgi:beta-glucosidase